MAKKKKRKNSFSGMKKMTPEKYIKTIARKLPIHKTFLTENIFKVGMGHAVVVRSKKNGEKVIGTYMIDVFCLGLKDTFYFIATPDEYETFLEEFVGLTALEEFPSNHIFNMIYGSIEYAEDLGFTPHKDFAISEFILDDVEGVEYEEIEFGRKGKPYFVAGKDDHASNIILTLEKSVGKGGFDCLVGIEEEFEIDGDLDVTISMLPEDGQKRFRRYLGILKILYKIFEEDFGKVKVLFDDEAYSFADAINEEVEKIQGERDDEITEKKVRHIVENFMVFEGLDFMYDPRVIDSFNDGFRKDLDSVNAPFFMALQLMLYVLGTEKLDLLHTMLIQFLAPDQEEEEQRRIIQSIRDEYRVQDEFKTDHVQKYMIEYLLEYIEYYEDVFGTDYVYQISNMEFS